MFFLRSIWLKQKRPVRQRQPLKLYDVEGVKKRQRERLAIRERRAAMLRHSKTTQNALKDNETTIPDESPEQQSQTQ